MYVKKRKNRSGKASVVVCEKIKGRYKEHNTIGVGITESEISDLVSKGKVWIRNYQTKQHPELDLYGDERHRYEEEQKTTNHFLSNIDNILINGTDLILSRVFDRIGFNQIKDDIFRKLVISRLCFPSSKAATVEYLKNYYDDDVDLSRIYWYLDLLNETLKDQVQQISVHHTMYILGGHIGVLFYDVTTLYFETDKEDELRKTGFSKEGHHKNPQVILGLLVSLDGYLLAYSIHEGNKYEGHTMLPVIKEFVNKYHLDNFIVVADSGLMNNDNITEPEELGYKYIIGERIKTESKTIITQILSHPKEDNKMFEINRRKFLRYTLTKSGQKV